MPLRVDSKVSLFDVVLFLLEVGRIGCSDDPTGELFWKLPLEILRKAPGPTSAAVRSCGRSEPVPKTAAALLPETAARLEDPVDLKKLELEGCI